MPMCGCRSWDIQSHTFSKRNILKERTVVLEKTLESPLDCKDIQPVHSEGDQPWDFFGRNDAKAETPVLWPPHAKSWLIGKGSDAGRDWKQEEKGTTEDEMAGWHHWLDGRESEWTPGVGDGQGGLECCDSWGRRVGHDWATDLIWSESVGLTNCKARFRFRFYTIVWLLSEICKAIDLRVMFLLCLSPQSPPWDCWMYSRITTPWRPLTSSGMGSCVYFHSHCCWQQRQNQTQPSTGFLLKNTAQTSCLLQNGAEKLGGAIWTIKQSNSRNAQEIG